MQKLSTMWMLGVVLATVAVGYVVVSRFDPAGLSAYWTGLLTNFISGVVVAALTLWRGDQLLMHLEERARLRAWAPVGERARAQLSAAIVQLYGSLNINLKTLSGRYDRSIPTKWFAEWAGTVRLIVQRSAKPEGGYDASILSPADWDVVRVVMESRRLLQVVARRLRSALDWRDTLPRDLVLLTARTLQSVEHADDQIRIGIEQGFDGDHVLTLMPAFADMLEVFQALEDAVPLRDR